MIMRSGRLGESGNGTWQIGQTGRQGPSADAARRGIPFALRVGDGHGIGERSGTVPATISPRGCPRMATKTMSRRRPHRAGHATLSGLAERLKPTAMPAAPRPMLCTLVAEPFDNPAWVFEPKY